MQVQAIMSMDMGMSMAPTSTGMAMPSMTMTPTASDMMPMATSSGGMGSMDDAMDMMGGCKISVSPVPCTCAIESLS